MTFVALGATKVNHVRTGRRGGPGGWRVPCGPGGAAGSGRVPGGPGGAAGVRAGARCRADRAVPRGSPPRTEGTLTQRCG